MISTRLETWVWCSHAVLAAELSPRGTILRANDALLRLADRAVQGEPVGALVAGPQRSALERRVEAAGDEWRPCTFAIAADPSRPASDRRVWLRRADDVVLLVAEPAVDQQELLVTKALELNDELVRTNRRLGAARAEAEAAAERLRRLEAVALAGLAGLDLEAVLHDLLRVIRDAVHADRAIVLLVDERRGDLAVGAAIGPEGPLSDALGTRIPRGSGVAGRVVEDGAPRLVGDLAQEGTLPVGVWGGARGLAAVALDAGAGSLGVLQVTSARPYAFDAGHLRLLLPAAERAALAIARVQVVERERRIAETLQRALLPDRLPEVPGYRLRAHFEPAAGEIGGDWYDALPLASGELALVIGDVAGKGVRAAALMGELRSGLRAYALDGGAPDLVLERLNRLAERTRHMATVSLVVLEPASGVLRYASAGHLPPLVAGPREQARFLRDAAAPPLPAYLRGKGPARTTLAPGARLILYTDGLVERRTEPIDASLDRLCAACAGYDGDVDGLAAHLVATLHPPEGALRDDIAVLVLERAAYSPGGWRTT
jgi:phosphoserine phosphatase RsbU/P